MGVGELTNDPGVRNNTRERVKGALHELDVLSSPSKTNVYASFDITLTAGAIGYARHPFTPPPLTTNQLYFADSSYANEVQICLGESKLPKNTLMFCGGGCYIRGVAPTVNIIDHCPAHGDW